MSKKTADAKPTIPSDKVSLKQITSSFNHRNPLSDLFKKDGYGVFQEDVPPGSDKTPLWTLATSDDPAQRAQFAALIDQYENPDNPEVTDSIITLSHNILSVGQLQHVLLRDNGGGKEKEKHTYQLVAGHRRSLAILYLWCKGLTKSAEPRVIARFVKGNHQDLQAMSISENIHRKPLNVIELATAYRQAINTGETEDEVATREGVSTATIKNRISLLELSPAVQDRVASRKIPYTKALQMVKNLRRSGNELTDDGKDVTTATASGTKKNMLPRKTVESLWETEKNADAKRAFALVLRLIELETEAEEEAPAEKGKAAEALELDEKGRLVVAKKK